MNLLSMPRPASVIGHGNHSTDVAGLELVASAENGFLRVCRGDIERAHSQAPHAVVLVFSAAEHEKSVGAAVKGSNVFAVLPTP